MIGGPNSRWWFRTEFQHRGTDHIHGVMWNLSEPDLCELGEKIKLRAAFEAGHLTEEEEAEIEPLELKEQA